MKVSPRHYPIKYFGEFLLKHKVLKRKDNQLTPPDYGCQEDLMTASGTFVAPYAQNLCKNHIKWHLVFNLAVPFMAGNNLLGYNSTTKS